MSKTLQKQSNNYPLKDILRTLQNYYINHYNRFLVSNAMGSFDDKNNLFPK